MWLVKAGAPTCNCPRATGLRSRGSGTRQWAPVPAVSRHPSLAARRCRSQTGGCAAPRRCLSAAVGAARPRLIPAPRSLQLVEAVPLPSLRECSHYVNLTNGAEALPALQRCGLPFRWVRAADAGRPAGWNRSTLARGIVVVLQAPSQPEAACPTLDPLHARTHTTHPRARSFARLTSTSCEQQLFEKLVCELDPDLLMSLALGRTCLLYDFGSRNKKRGKALSRMSPTPAEAAHCCAE